MSEKIDLNQTAERIARWCEDRRVPDAPYGTYKFTAHDDPNFYASADIAIIRWIIGEDLKTALTPTQRAEWAGVINSYQNPIDGRFGPEMGHHVLHANGSATNALCILGERYKYPVRFYDLFNTPETIGPWLSNINWNNAWGASHLIWGGPALWINSAKATPEWKEACFAWFEQQLNQFGSWPKDFAYSLTPPISPLGCAVHVWPLYRHTGRPVLGLEVLADYVTDWQNPEGYWDGVSKYGTMDALYVLAVAIEEGLPNQSSYRDALYRYMKVHFPAGRASWVSVNAHYVLCWSSCIGYLQRALPDEFSGDIRWGDIFDLSEIYQLDAVQI
ncbi:MAG: hypothetical protein CL610_10370 [Anaerolineaceae bacterium]|nr:hypothetical protein [Anaerolineaceae bacterium]